MLILRHPGTSLKDKLGATGVCPNPGPTPVDPNPNDTHNISLQSYNITSAYTHRHMLEDPRPHIRCLQETSLTGAQMHQLTSLLKHRGYRTQFANTDPEAVRPLREELWRNLNMVHIILPLSLGSLIASKPMGAANFWLLPCLMVRSWS